MNQKCHKNLFLKLFLLTLFPVYFLIHPISVYGFFAPDNNQNKNIGKRNLISDPVYNEQKDKVLYSLTAIDGGNFEQEYGNQWRAIVDPVTNRPSRIYGGHAPLKITNGLIDSEEYIDEEILVSACIDFINQNESLFKIDSKDLKLSKVVDKNWIRFVHFEQTYNQKSVNGSFLSFIIENNCDIVSMSMNLYPNIDLDKPPEINIVTYQEIITKNLNLEDSINSENLEFSNPEIIVYPQGITSSPNVDFVWALRYDVKIESPIQKWCYYISLYDPKVLYKTDLAHHLISGKVSGKILPKYYNDQEKDLPLPNLRVSLLKNTSPLYYNDLNTDPGWDGTRPGYGWEFGKPIPKNGTDGGKDPYGGHTGNNVYGFNLEGSYPLNMKEPQYLTMTDQVDCSTAQEVTLMFWRWLGVEGSEADKATVDVWDIAAANWQNLWGNGKNDLYDGAWRLMFYDMSRLVGGNPEVMIRWGMGPTDDYINFCGWNIDDIGIYRSIRSYSDEDGSYYISGEDSKNILIADLEGIYFKVINDKGANIVYSQDNVLPNSQYKNFSFSKNSNYNQLSNTGVLNSLADIDEINVYYHANKMLQYIKDIDPDFMKTTDKISLPINITVRYGDKYNNSFWLPGEGIFFGQGDGFEFRNFAHFADIIYHEVNHAITDNIYGYLRGNNFGLNDPVRGVVTRFTEFDAMHEAFSDYFACSVTNDSKIAEGGFWMLPGKEYIRNLENELYYKFDYGDELYQSSSILSGAMWNVRKRLIEKSGQPGIRIADTLFHFARAAEAKTFRNYLIDVLLINKIRYSNAHEALIKDSFGEKGISIPPPPPEGVEVIETSDGIEVSWVKNSEAAGYYLYYTEENFLLPSNERALLGSEVYDNKIIRYSTDGSSSGGESQGGDNSDRTPGDNSNNNNDSSSQTQNDDSPSEQTGDDLGGDTNSVTDNRIDIGDTDTYKLTGLDKGVYLIEITAYDKYGVEGIPSNAKYLSVNESQSSTNQEIRYVGDDEKKGISLNCFISIL